MCNAKVIYSPIVRLPLVRHLLRPSLSSPNPGEIDPWHELSVTSNGNWMDKDRAIYIKGTSHCADMEPEEKSDRESLREAREEIERHVAIWLKSAAWELMMR
ncbi:thymus-specific serine protease-like [Clupea harengus]|uniref:Thymus-specific serine protease-like n=1 Tax=Clupea harengus TaxID=7950 RepID=A0A8M1KBB2_CLUHA|nr:thymus-specific serine protease-like [Clupea harengus]